MNGMWLFLIIPLTLIIGGILGLWIGLIAMNTLSETVSNIDECCIDTLTYAVNHNADCSVLISGYMRECVCMRVDKRWISWSLWVFLRSFERELPAEEGFWGSFKY